MGFLDRAIRRGISEGVGRAVGEAITKAVEPKVTEYTNKAAGHIDNASQQMSQQTMRSTGLEGAFSNLEKAASGYATEMSKNMKVCPNCEKPTTADKKFCPSCGTKLPEQTVAEGAVCTNCGKQNTIGTKFCQECGSKLPAAIQEEQAAAERDASVMAEWDEKLSVYPKWNCGGVKPYIDEYDTYYVFSTSFSGNDYAARQSVEQYRQVLMQNGFRQAGQYPDIAHLYKMVEGVCYHVDTEHCFEGDSDSPTIYFTTGEPTGGFNYVKPEPKQKTSLKDLFGL